MAVRIKFDRAGFRALLNDPGVAADLRRRAEAIASSADGASGGVHVVRSETGGARARAAVVTADVQAIRAESRGHTLSSSLAAGRG